MVCGEKYLPGNFLRLDAQAILPTTTSAMELSMAGASTFTVRQQMPGMFKCPCHGRAVQFVKAPVPEALIPRSYASASAVARTMYILLKQHEIVWEPL